MYRKDLKNKRFNIEINDNKISTRRIKRGCVMYYVFLCRKENYVKRFHDSDDDMKFIE